MAWRRSQARFAREEFALSAIARPGLAARLPRPRALDADRLHQQGEVRRVAVLFNVSVGRAITDANEAAIAPAQVEP